MEPIGSMVGLLAGCLQIPSYNNAVTDLLMQHSKGKAALVFCSTRKGAQEAALTLAGAVTKLGLKNPFLRSYEQFERLQVIAMSSNDKHMQTCIKSAGIEGSYIGDFILYAKMISLNEWKN